MRRPSSKRLVALAFVVVATVTGIGCEDDSSIGFGSFDAGSGADIVVPLPTEADATPDDAGSDADAEPVDAGPAVLDHTVPLDGRVGVGTATTISVTFNTPMQTLGAQPASGACTGSLRLSAGPDFTTCVGGTVTTSDNVTFTFTPAASLGVSTRYKLAVSASTAVDGRQTVDYAMVNGFLTHAFPVDAKILYMASALTGNLGGIAGADTACSTLASRPVGVTAAKAMITGPTRTACSVANCGAGNAQVDWALHANQHYVRADGAYVFLTEGNGIFTAYPAQHDLGSGVNFWDGLNANWTTRGPNCADWTSALPSDQGAVGYDVGLNGAWLAGGQLTCNNGRPFVCAEQ